MAKRAPDYCHTGGCLERGGLKWMFMPFTISGPGAGGMVAPYCTKHQREVRSFGGKEVVSDYLPPFAPTKPATVTPP